MNQSLFLLPVPAPAPAPRGKLSSLGEAARRAVGLPLSKPTCPGDYKDGDDFIERLKKEGEAVVQEASLGFKDEPMTEASNKRGRGEGVTTSGEDKTDDPFGDMSDNDL